MRGLRVLGLADGVPGASRNLLLEDPATGEQFTTRCDERLLAATRGDVSRFGQSATELESQLRPKEIQARIRAGATVEQIAALAGTSLSRVERFAYPVLLERASVVEKALKARPAIDGITGSASVAETVAATLAARGHDGSMAWDAYKDDAGWVLALTWSAGRSENKAQWLFHPGPDGGTLSARDDAAAEIVDPALRILRPLRQVRPESVAPPLLDPTVATESLHRSSEAASRSAHPAGGKLRSPAARAPELSPTRSTSGSTPFGRQPLPTSLAGGVAVGSGVASGVGVGVGSGVASAAGVAVTGGNAERVLAEPVISESMPVESMPVESVPVQPVSAPPVLAEAVSDRLTEELLRDDRANVNPVATQVENVRTGTEPVTRAAGAPTAATGPGAPARPAPSRSSGVQPGTARAAKRGNRPAMPSWEDVLLGTRSDKTAGR